MARSRRCSAFFARAESSLRPSPVSGSDRLARGERPELLGRGPERGLADGLGLEERPQVGGLDVGIQRLGLGRLAQGLREREHQREHRDQERDALVVRTVRFDVRA
jgi:hypothetical protein